MVRDSSTRHYIKYNWKLYYETCLYESGAHRRENYLKTTQGRRLLKRRIKDYLFRSREDFAK